MDLAEWRSIIDDQKRLYVSINYKEERDLIRSESMRLDENSVNSCKWLLSFRRVICFTKTFLLAGGKIQGLAREGVHFTCQ